MERFLIVGLGNPGDKFRFTRHNVGFMILDELAKLKEVSFTKKGRGAYANIDGATLLKPLTYMNLSGEELRTHLNNNSYKDVIVIYDDIAYELGYIKIKRGCRSSHNGIRSIRAVKEDFISLRIGIGKSENLSEYVLSKFSEVEKTILNKTIKVSIEALLAILSNELQEVQNEYNGQIK